MPKAKMLGGSISWVLADGSKFEAEFPFTGEVPQEVLDAKPHKFKVLGQPEPEPTEATTETTVSKPSDGVVPDPEDTGQGDSRRKRSRKK